MNLFVTDINPAIAATHLDDMRLNKMITESCQMIVMAMVQNGLPHSKIPLTKAGTPYRVKGHANHPITKWTGMTRGNFHWHVLYLFSMLKEYHLRTGKIRTGENIIASAIDNYSLIPDGDLEPFYNCSTHRGGDTITAYRLTLLDKWEKDKIKVKWTNIEPPKWATSLQTIKIDNVYYRYTAKDNLAIEQALTDVAE